MIVRVDGINVFFFSEYLVLINNLGVGFVGFLLNFLRIVLFLNFCLDFLK